jgi:hypothetical protein
MSVEKKNAGMLECWNAGMLGLKHNAGMLLRGSSLETGAEGGCCAAV